MKKALFLIILMIAVLSLYFLVRIGRENSSVTSDLERERYLRMTTEEEQQKSIMRIRKLEDELRTAQVRLVKAQESADREKDMNAELKKQLERSGQAKELLEKSLEDVSRRKAALELMNKDAEVRAALQEQAARGQPAP
jgi:hypothetical protein